MKKINQEWKTTDQFGFIYIMSNPSFPYLLKIGKTTRTTIERAKEISSSSGVPTSFKIDYEIRTSSLDDAEKNIHKQLDKYRHRKEREFFKLPLNQAIIIVKGEIIRLLETEIGSLKTDLDKRVEKRRNDLIEEIENKRKILSDLKPEPSLNNIKRKHYTEEQKKIANKLYNNGAKKINTWDYYRAIELLARAANLGHRKAQYILFDRKDTSSFPYPEKLTDEEFYEIGMETKDMNFINRASELGNLKAKTFIEQNEKFY
jgi:hypothetical protein|tara:strand:- start:649 stop:1428 length:780 start_codon:yes stop_codon:yes gene_type:complete